MTENALKAKSNGVRPPFGYYVDDTDHYQIDETLAPVVKEIFTLYLDGMRINDIAKHLNERGIKHKGFEMKYNAVFRILTNRKYIGEYKFGDIVIPNAIPAIIDEATFNSVQQRMARNKKAPAMHRSEDDYLLTTKLFCGKCGAMMTGVIGTSHTSRQYRYYKCNQSKQGKCDKKTVKKEWLEELVLDEIKELLSSDEVVEELADRVYELQQQEDNAATSIQAQLSGVETKLNNLVEAITQGIYSSTTKKTLDELEERKRNLEIELFEAQMRNPVLTKEQILFALYNFRKIDISTQEGKQRLIDVFVNSIYLYDDHFVITYNYKGQSKTVTFEELNSSPLTAKGSPTKNTGNRLCFLLVAPSGAADPKGSREQALPATPRRLVAGKAPWQSARFACRLARSACRSSSQKSRSAAIFGSPVLSLAGFRRPVGSKVMKYQVKSLCFFIGRAVRRGEPAWRLPRAYRSGLPFYSRICTFGTGLVFGEGLLQLRVYIAPAVHDADDRDRLFFTARNIEHQIIIHGHDAQVPLFPRFFIVEMIPLRHFVERQDRLFQTVKLVECVLSREQIVGYVLKNGAQVRGRLFGRKNFVFHAL